MPMEASAADVVVIGEENLLVTRALQAVKLPALLVRPGE